MFSSILQWRYALAWGIMALTLAGCGNVSKIDPLLGVAPSPRVTTALNIPPGGGRYLIGRPYKIAGTWYRPREVDRHEQVGLASWYGSAFHGRKTANGETFNMNALTAAHPTLPLPSYVRVTNLQNNHSVVVRVNDRGPFSGGRIIDVSKRVADLLQFRQQGVAKVHIAYLGQAPLHGRDHAFLMDSLQQNGGLSDGFVLPAYAPEAPAIGQGTPLAAYGKRGVGLLDERSLQPGFTP